MTAPPAGRCALAALALLCPINKARSAEWTLQPDAQLHVLSETNPGLVPSDRGSTHARGLTAAANLLLQRRLETSSVRLTGRASQRRYDHSTALDRTDINLGLDWQAQRERTSWQASAAATRDTTLTSELGLTGQTGARYRHESLTGSAGMSWIASERLTGTASTSVSFDTYPGQRSGLVDYRYRAADIGADYMLGRRSSLGVNLRRGELAVSGRGNRSTDSTVMLQYRWQPTELLSLSVGAGPAWTRGVAGTERGESLSVGLERSGERSSMQASVRRHIAPTGRGYLTKRDDAHLQYSTRVTEGLTVDASASYLRSTDVLAASDVRLGEVRYRRASAGLAWRFRQHWSLSASAGYADQLSRATAAHGHGLEFRTGIGWNGRSHVW